VRLTARAGGFTLVEALIALAVLSVGLLGSAVLLLESLRAQADTLRRVVAANVLLDMAERIRANPAAGPLYGTASAQPGAPACAASGCDIAQLAAADLSHFAQGARATLPGVSIAAIEFAPAIGPAAPHRYLISLRWQDPRADEDESVTLQMLASPVAG
jgi:type IV pilus assembly protein PilV